MYAFLKNKKTRVGIGILLSIIFFVIVYYLRTIFIPFFIGLIIAYMLNPMAVLLDSYRRVVLYGQTPEWGYLGLATLVSLLVTLFAYRYFKQAERQFADLI